MPKRGQGEGSISKRPDGTWWARVTLGKDENGKQVRKAFYGKTRKEVQEKLTTAINELNQGTYFEDSDILLKDWIMTWLREYKKPRLKSTSYRTYNDWITGYIIPHLGDYPLNVLRGDMVQRFVTYMANKGLASGSISVTIEILKACLRQAMKNQLVKKNAAADVVLPPQKRTKRESLSREEQEQFLQEAKHSCHGEIFILILATGLRLGEALALKWSDIDFETGVLHVQRTQIIHKDFDNEICGQVLATNSPKTKSSIRTVPLLPYLVGMLHDIKHKQETQGIPLPRYGRFQPRQYFDEADTEEKYPYVFSNAYGQMLNPGGVRDNFKMILKHCGISKNYSPHCLRHTFATRGLEDGIPMKVMQELLGHSTLKMTADQYTHVLPETKMESIMKLADTIVL